MTRPLMRLAFLTALLIAALVAVGCGDDQEGLRGNDAFVSLDTDSEVLQRGAYLFNQKCSGCHTFEVANAEGSATDIHDREYKDGPNFADRQESYEDVLYAIRNGGFSSGPMPQNIVVGREARLVACFVAVYSGGGIGGEGAAGPGEQEPNVDQGAGPGVDERGTPPGAPTPTGAGGDSNCVQELSQSGG